MGEREDREQDPAGQGQASPDGPDGPDEAHTVPPGVDEATVQALGLVSEALETVERARGALYDLHQLIGGADFTLGDAVRALREAGHEQWAQRVQTELVGRNVLPGRWTFQVVEEFDDTYWQPFRDLERELREALAGGRRHLHEARMKEQRRTHGHRDHRARP